MPVPVKMTGCALAARALRLGHSSRLTGVGSRDRALAARCCVRALIALPGRARRRLSRCGHVPLLRPRAARRCGTSPGGELPSSPPQLPSNLLGKHAFLCVLPPTPASRPTIDATPAGPATPRRRRRITHPVPGKRNAIDGHSGLHARRWPLLMTLPGVGWRSGALRWGACLDGWQCHVRSHGYASARIVSRWLHVALSARPRCTLSRITYAYWQQQRVASMLSCRFLSVFFLMGTYLTGWQLGSFCERLWDG